MVNRIESTGLYEFHERWNLDDEKAFWFKHTPDVAEEAFHVVHVPDDVLSRDDVGPAVFVQEIIRRLAVPETMDFRVAFREAVLRDIHDKNLRRIAPVVILGHLQ